ncbi:hypothetical protein QQF64_010385 [Cirrhinus molitorella]|uniref:Uncharacterized protein n=2 Tax=Cirrhinus molitorella TaxID=172907 RepID=A0ABR3M3X9_9TELE|nr:hypothetical protein Q8A67_007479 [Cirrhinus molitorella]
MCWKMTFYVWFVSLSFFIVPAFTTVIETTQHYNCTEELHHAQSEYAIKNPDCDQYWSSQDHSIATFLRSTPECHSPCIELSVGRIVLIDCVNITLAVICSGDYLTEHRIHFYGQRFPQSLINPVHREHFGIFPSIALVVIAIAVFLLCVGCAHCTHKQQMQCSNHSL